MRKLIVVMVLLVLVLSAFGPGLAAAKNPDLPIEMTGDLGGAAYIIQVPGNWNGTLLVYAHGYAPDGEAEPEPAFLVADELLARGYALAASGYRGTGFNLLDAIKDTKKLVQHFRRTVGKPERTVLYGNSMGGSLTIQSMEKYPGTYDAGIPLCAPASGITRNTSTRFSFALAYDAAFGWDESWGAINDVRDDIDFYADVLFPKTIYELGLSYMPGYPFNKPLWEFARLVSDLPAGGFYEYSGPVDMPPGAVALTFFMTRTRADIEMKAGGIVSGNEGYVYGLTAAERAYLLGLDPAMDIDGMLASMNAQTGYRTDPWAQAYLNRVDEARGQIHSPVLMVHNIDDPVTPVEGTTHYARLVAGKGNQALLTRVYSELDGHCNFTEAQLLTFFDAMDAWLDTGVAPTAASFAGTPDLTVNFEPGPWPQPPAD